MRTLKIVGLGGLLVSLLISILWSMGFETISAEQSPPQSPKETNLRSGAWSDPSIWGNLRVPPSGERVTIAEDTTVTYDVFSQVEIAALHINGSLIFSRDVNTNLDVGNVFVHRQGYLEIGTALDPIPAGVEATLRFVNAEDGEHGLHISGEGQIHGHALHHVYTRLAESASKDSTAISVEDFVEWAPGDQIVIASTSQNPEDSEIKVVDSVKGRNLILNSPLKFQHDGEQPTQAHVALLTRNVLITSKYPAFRGHTRFLEGAKGSISYAEFRGLGARKQMGKYPIHFHHVGDTMRQSYVKGAAIWDSGNRFITVHSTQYVTLNDNVGYDAVGHGFFLETGDEVFVTLDGNLGIGVKPGQILKSDRFPAVFWIQNPQNTLINNIAVSSFKGNGFEFAIPGGQIDIPPIGGQVTPRKLPLLKFEGNEAYSNGRFGVRVYRFNTPGNHRSELVDLKVWRNRKAGLSLRGNRMTVSGAFVFGNKETNLVISGNNNLVANSRILGEVGLAADRGDQTHRPTVRGLVFGGKGNRVSQSWFGNHVSSKGVTGSDISLGQMNGKPVTLKISDSIMNSDRPILFGYPINEGSRLDVDSYQGVPNNDFSLSRIDIDKSEVCRTAVADLEFLAMKCFR